MVADDLTLVRNPSPRRPPLTHSPRAPGVCVCMCVQMGVLRLQCWARTLSAKRELRKRYRRLMLARDSVRASATPLLGVCSKSCAAAPQEALGKLKAAQDRMRLKMVRLI